MTPIEVRLGFLHKLHLYKFALVPGVSPGEDMPMLKHQAGAHRCLDQKPIGEHVDAVEFRISDSRNLPPGLKP
jgi:hypothetical protein